MAQICTYIGQFFSGGVDPSTPHLVLILLTVCGGLAVGIGIVWEAARAGHLRDAPTILVIIGVVIEAAATVILFEFDEGISHAQQSNIIALEKQADQSLLNATHEEIRAAGFELDAEEAKERAAGLELDVAQAKKDAERERFARVKLEAQLAPRRITPEIRQRMRQAVPASGSLSMTISSYLLDAESNILCLQIAEALGQQATSCGTILGVGTIALGIHVSGKNPDLARALTDAFNSSKLFAVMNAWGVAGATTDDVAIFVAVKPIAK